MNLKIDAPNQPGSMFRRLQWKVSPIRLMLTLLLMIFLLLGVHTIYRVLMQSEIGMVQFIVKGESLILDETAQAELSRDLQIQLAGLDDQIERRLQPWKGNALAEIEGDFQDAGESYLDWYFSLRGSYTRLGVAVLGDLEPWMEDQIQERLVKESGLESSLVTLNENNTKRLIEAEQEWLDETLTNLQSRYAPLAVKMNEGEASQLKTVNLDRLLGGVKEDQFQLPRWNDTHVGSGVLGGLAGYVIAKRVAKSSAIQAARIMVSQFVTRMGVHATRSAATGGATAAATSPSGLGAVFAGVAVTGASVAMAAGTEFAALKAQEALQRPAMEAELENTWSELELELNLLLQAEKQAREEAMLEHLERRAAQEKQNSELPKTYRIFE